MAVCVGVGRTRAWALLWLVASLALTGINAYAKVREAEKVRDIKRRYERRQLPDTNEPARPVIMMSMLVGV